MSHLKSSFLCSLLSFILLLQADARRSLEWGGRGGDEFSDGLSRGIRRIQLRHGNRIDMIKVTYDQDGVLVSGSQHGGNGGTRAMISLDYPDEYLLEISGSYDMNVNSLLLRTRRRSNNTNKVYGPFGVPRGRAFRSEHGKVVGFFGRSGRYLDAIGVYFEVPSCGNYSHW